MITPEEQITLDAILAARKVQEFLWGEQNQNWGLEEWRRMFRKRIKKIDDIQTDNPYAAIELKKRLLQNAALSIALIHKINSGMLEETTDQYSNLNEYAKRTLEISKKEHEQSLINRMEADREINI